MQLEVTALAPMNIRPAMMIAYCSAKIRIRKRHAHPSIPAFAISFLKSLDEKRNVHCSGCLKNMMKQEVPYKILF
ncbi:MAG: hypothetical protein ABF876_01835 [Acetobacter aceti]|uniref:Uncharacterized protein n=1 Tax=Acetobacter aceti TaxID=435 RepID=A0A1U9KK22_ACEAC|nr:hypothetical protein [Acetobacter aceti]AQS86151.1 hypothetical protein A0U92_16865 [Acetobacter aceti]